MFRAHRVAAFGLLLVIAVLVAFRSGSGVSAPLQRRDVDGARLGGFSGLESLQGGVLLALSDRGYLARIDIAGFDAAGGGERVPVTRGPPLRDTGGSVMTRPAFDAEGLALAPGGDRLIVFENPLRVWRYPADGATPAAVVPLPFPAGSVPPNTGVEALAISPDGAVWLLPEAPLAADGGVDLWRFADGDWRRLGPLPRRAGFRPVGADVGPDGALYVLERALVVPLGFASRIRRLEVSHDAVLSGAEVWRARAGRFGNLEGIAVVDGGAWLIADDNLNAVQRSQIVRVALP